MTPLDSADVELRDRYRRLNASFKPSFAFRFGRGRGFSAEMLGLVKTMMWCLEHKTRLCLSRGGQPAGIGVASGLTDYFEPMFPEVDAGIFNALNKRSVRGSGRFPIMRRGVRRLLRAATGSDRFMMDDLGALPERLRAPELGVDAGYWDACAMLVRFVWVYRPEVGREIFATVADCKVPDSYVAVHVRRGDKNQEAPYTALDQYVAAIGLARPQGSVVVVASDDASTVGELTRLLPSQFPVISLSQPSNRGYVQAEFNDLPPSERFRQVKRFLAELEVLRRGEVFVGAAQSNVTYLVEMMRGGVGVVQVGPMAGAP